MTHKKSVVSDLNKIKSTEPHCYFFS